MPVEVIDIGGNLVEFSFSDDADLQNQAKRAYESLSVPVVDERKEDAGFLGGFSSGIDVLQQLGGSAVEATGELLGVEGIREYGKGVRERNIEEGSEFPGIRWADVSDVGDLWQFAKYSTGQAVPMLGAVIASTVVGGPTGGLAAAYTLGTGSVQSAIKEINPDLEAPGYAFGGGALVAALDKITPGRLGTEISKSIARKWGKENAESATKEVAENVISGRLQAALKEGGKTAVIEGMTEPAQELIETYVAAMATDTTVDIDELLDNMAEASAAAMFGSFAPGAAIGGSVYQSEAAKKEVAQQDFKARAESARELDNAYNIIDTNPIGSVNRSSRESILKEMGLSPENKSKARAYWSKRELSEDAFAAEGVTKDDALNAERQNLFEEIRINEKLANISAPLAIAAPDMQPSDTLAVTPEGVASPLSGFEESGLTKSREDYHQAINEEDVRKLDIGLTPDIERLLKTIEERVATSTEFAEGLSVEVALQNMAKRGSLQEAVGDGKFANISDREYADFIQKEAVDPSIIKSIPKIPAHLTEGIGDGIPINISDIEDMEVAERYVEDAKNWVEDSSKALARMETPRAGKSFMSFINSLGGINSVHSDDLKQVGIEGAASRIMYKGGKSLDDIGEAAFEAGYFKERPTESEVLDAIGRDLSATGKKVYPVYSKNLEDILNREDRKKLQSELSLIGDQVGIDWNKYYNAEKKNIAKENRTKKVVEKISKKPVNKAVEKQDVKVEVIEREKQLVIPGAEKISDKELAERKMEAPKRTSVEQKKADEGLFDIEGRKQIDLVDEISKSKTEPPKIEKEELEKDTRGMGEPISPTGEKGIPPIKTREELKKSPVAKIEDFGETISGARKELWEGYKDKLSSELPSNYADIVLSKHFPTPDYEGLINGGADVRVLSAIKAMRDMIPNKPRKAWRLKEWGDRVSQLRLFSSNLISGKISIDKYMEKLKDYPKLDDLTNSVILYSKLGYPAFIKAKGYEIGFGEYTILNGKKLDSPVAKYTIRSKGNMDRGYADTYDLAVDKLRYILENQPTTEKRTTKLDVYQVTRTGEIIVGKKVGSNKFIDLKKGFDSVKEAHTYLKDNEAELVSLLEKKKTLQPVRRSVNDPRKGVDYRMGDNILPEKFASEFGFRGVQFGNYVEQVRRQDDLNNAYDALLDLSNLLNIPPHAISLNGELALAFGARGRGGKGAGAAHYEQTQTVINLTKEAGFGSLGHEWWHALDNYLNKARGKEGYFTEKPIAIRGVVGKEFKIIDTTRPELIEAFNKLSKSLKALDYIKRAKQLDILRTKDYWSTTRELSARAFETYLMAKNKEAGGKNDYLANVIEEEVMAIFDSQPYAYPTKDEQVEINSAFDNFFSVLKTKETDKGTDVYSVKPDNVETKKFQKLKSEIKSEILEEAQRINPNVTINFVDNLFGEGERLLASGLKSKGKAEVGGSYNDVKNLITLSMNVNKFDPVDTGYHELWHSLEGVLNEQEQSMLQEKYPAKDGISHDERVAYAFSDWVMGGKINGGTPAIRRVFNKIKKFIEAIGNIFRGYGFNSIDDIFSKGLSGEFGKRVPVGKKQKGDVYSVGSVLQSNVSKIDLKKAKDNLSNFWRKYGVRHLTKEGYLGADIFQILQERRHILSVNEFDVGNIAGDFRKVAAKAYGKKNYKRISALDKEKMRDYLSGADIDLPQNVKEELSVMRSYIDNMSADMQNAIQDIIDIKIKNLSEKQLGEYKLWLSSGGAEGKLPADMQADLNMLHKIEENKGAYLNRSYQAFDDPKWKDTVLKDKSIMNAAEEYIAEQNPELTDSEVTGVVLEILEKAREKADPMQFFGGSTKVGKKEVSFLKKRKDVPLEIRELLGEYKDPEISFLKSTSKMSNNLAGHHFLKKMYDDNYGVILFDKPTGEFHKQIAGEGSEVMNPLNGLYTTVDINIGLEDATGNKGVNSEWLRKWIVINSAIKYGKTILSPTTQSRNFISASFFAIANGHFDFSKTAKALKATKSDLMGNDKQQRTYLRRVTELGVIGDNPYAGELKGVISDAIEFGYLDGKGKIADVLNFMQKLYRLGDDFWKIVGFENEIDLLMKYKGLSRAEAEPIAAKRIVKTYPTYSMVPKFIQELRRFPLAGTFVSFPWEIARTYKNLVQLMIEDYKNGDKELAARRLVGLSAATGITYAVGKLSMLVMGIGDEEDEAFKKLAPEWQRNSTFIYFGYDEDGNPIYLDMSALDPYAYLKKPLRALFGNSGEDISKRSIDAIIEVGSPFFGADMAATNIGEILFNKKVNGGTVYNENDDTSEQAQQILNHIRKLAPGFTSNIERMYKAVDGQTSRSGKKFNVGEELLALGGLRFTTNDLSTNLVYQGYGFMDDKRGSTKILSYELGESGELSESDIKEVYDRMIYARERAYKDMLKIVKAAKSLGVSNEQIHTSLRVSKVGKRDIFSLLKGEIPRWSPSSQFLKSTMQRSLLSAKGPKERRVIINEYNKRRKYVYSLVRGGAVKKLYSNEIAKNITSGNVNEAISSVEKTRPIDVGKIINDTGISELKTIYETKLNKRSIEAYNRILSRG